MPMELKILRKCFVAASYYNYLPHFLGTSSDNFTENFQLKKNKTKMRNIHPRFFHLLFRG